MAKFILILREDPATFASLSPDEMQAILTGYQAWSDKLAGAGLLAGGEKLGDEGGRRLTARDGTLVVSDGPYAEAKEVIGGFFIIEAEDYPAAEAIAAECPHLRHGVVELRRIDDMSCG